MMGTLYAILKNERARGVLLNATFLFLVATAWISDRWPQLTIPALAIAFAVVLGEVALLYFMAKRTRSISEVEDSISQNVERQEVRSSGNRPADPPQTDVTFLNDWKQTNYSNIGLILSRRQYALLRHQHLLHLQRPRASLASTWALASLYDERSLSEAIARAWLLRELENKVEMIAPLSSDLAKLKAIEAAKWEIVPQGDQAFSIVAGSLVIEHFHGRTNIRVIESSQVNVEGETRGTKSKVAPPDICAPIWN